MLCLFPANRLLLYSISMRPAWGVRGRRRSRGEEEGKVGEQSLYSRLSSRARRAALAGASYVMWLAGPTSLFTALLHTLIPTEEQALLWRKKRREGEQIANQQRKCDYKSFSLSSAPHPIHWHLPLSSLPKDNAENDISIADAWPKQREEEEGEASNITFTQIPMYDNNDIHSTNM